MKKRWIALGVVAAIASIGAGVFAFQRPIAQAMFTAAVREGMTRDWAKSLPDGLHVFVCGSGSPAPDPGRAGPCIAILAGSRAFVFDVGAGSAARLVRMGFNVGAIERVFLTHLHSDHIDGFGDLMLQSWVAGARTTPLPVSGPVGTAKVASGFNTAFEIDSSYRIAHHGAEIVPPSGYGLSATEVAAPTNDGAPIVVFKDTDITISAFSVSHAPVHSAFGYRIDYRGRSVVLSGDTAFDPHVIAAAKETDVLLHEALQPTMANTLEREAAAAGRAGIAKVMHDVLSYHTSPEDAAKAAHQAGAKILVLYHLFPPVPNRLVEPLFLGDAAANYAGPIELAKDGMLISLPSGGQTRSIAQAY